VSDASRPKARLRDPRSRQRRHLGITFVVVLLGTLAARASGLDLEALFGETGWGNARDILSGLAEPDTAPDFLARIAQLTLESVAIGVVGVALALALGVPLAILAVKVPNLLDAPSDDRSRRWASGSLRAVARATLAVLRSVPEIVWAYLFVRIFGLGPGPAVLAIGLSFAGIMGKLYAELLEAVDPAPVRAVRSSGAGWLGSLVRGALPQVTSQWVGYGLFRLECAVRSASILGVVGAGGIGAEIALSIRYFQYDKLATALLAVLACVVLLEVGSAALRAMRPRASIMLLIASTILGGVQLNIPWSQLFTPAAAHQTGAFLSGFAQPTTDAAFLGHGLDLILITVSMAFAGTLFATGVAFVMAPFATRLLTIRGYLDDIPRRAGPAWLLFIGTRLVFQSLRALPELVWALVFVVWVGPGPFAGTLAIGVHTIGILGRLFSETYEDAEPGPVRALEASGASPLGCWAVGVLPQVGPRLLAFALFRFEVNIRATAMVGFVGAGGIGDAIHTAISLFHMADLASLMMLLFALVIVVDTAGDALRRRLLR
jgi:phosphonate transport system permease protein